MYIIVFLFCFTLGFPHHTPSTAKPAKVVVSGDVVTRQVLVDNEKFMELAINHLGTRASVDVIELHLKALYDYIAVPVPSTLNSNIYIYIYHLNPLSLGCTLGCTTIPLLFQIPINAA